MFRLQPVPIVWDYDNIFIFESKNLFETSDLGLRIADFNKEKVLFLTLSPAPCALYPFYSIEYRESSIEHRETRDQQPVAR